VIDAGPTFETVPAAVDNGNTIYTRASAVDGNGESCCVASRGDKLCSMVG
jgi:hypothetical protein